MLTQIRSLFRHMEWADALTWSSVTSAASGADAAALMERVYHVHAVQWAYLQIWRGETVNIPERATFADRPSLQAWARAYYAELPRFLDTLDESALERIITLPWAGEIAERFGSANPATMGETMLQVALHTTHHRGQLATKIRELGTDPPLVDFVAWIWMGRPAPAWEPTA